MADEAREYVRAAQQAELSGDKPRAVELLRKAAALARSGGNDQRALQLLRHAQRLDGGHGELADEIHRLEWLPDKPLLRAVEDEERETEEALGPLRDLEGSDRKMFDRGPTRADPNLAAWCSFCCRPRTEVGDLVAGPAGAFICASCLRESMRLLEVALPAPPPVAVPTPPEPPRQAEPSPDGAELVGQHDAVEMVRRGLDRGLGWILVVGPAGSGKTTFLRALARRGAGRYLATPAALEEPWGDERLLVDGLDAASPADAQSLVDALGRVRKVVLAVRGAALAPRLVAGSELAGELRIHTTADLLAACGNALPPPVAERIHLVASFQALAVPELVEIGNRLLAPRASEVKLSVELQEAIAAEAFRSGRGAHELKVLLERIPAGSWSLRSAPPAPGARAPGGGRSRCKGKPLP